MSEAELSSHYGGIADGRVADALGLLYCHLPLPQREFAVGQARSALARGEISLYLSPCGGGAMLYHAAPGALGMVFPPAAVSETLQAQIEDGLVNGVRAELARRGVKVCQAIVQPEEMARAQSLLRNGFRRIATLWCLQRRLDAALPASKSKPTLRFEPASAADPTIFRDTLQRTYEYSLDTPELNGLRTVEEEMQSHRAQGFHDPARWWLAWDGATPVGVVMLSAQPIRGAWDLLYMGVVPEARGRGFGKQFVAKAISEARVAGGQMLQLTMDARNAPAYALYESLGFQRTGEREVLLAVLTQA